MAHQFSRLVFTEAVRRLQERSGSLRQYARKAESGPNQDALGPDEVQFIEQRDSFYIASEGENGWPYVQHRGGPKGFLKVLDAKTLVFGDFSGNRQYITAGNVSHNDRVTLFLMDYPHQIRLKILGHASIAEDPIDSGLARAVLVDYSAKVERVFKIHVVAFDWNCQQHITPRYTAQEMLEHISASGPVSP